MPTFQIFQQGQKVEEIVGADAQNLEALCTKYNAASSPFSGQGRKLGSKPLPFPVFTDLHHSLRSVKAEQRATGDLCGVLSFLACVSVGHSICNNTPPQ